MEHQQGHPWIPNKNGSKFISKMWVITNVKQHQWSFWFRSSVLLKRRLINKQLKSKNILIAMQCRYTKMLQTHWFRPDYRIHHKSFFRCQYRQPRYLMINENRDSHYFLIFAKSIVAPVKYVSIPGLELTAATLLVKYLEKRVGYSCCIRRTFGR